MTERTRKILILSALPIALIWGYYNLFVARSTSLSPSAAAAPETISRLTAKASSDTTAARLEQIKAEPWGDDPFRMSSHPSAPVHEHARPVVSEPHSGLVWELNGILYSESAPFAYINRRSVKVGDTVSTATVVAIERKSVTLEVAGKRFKISLSKDAQS